MCVLVKFNFLLVVLLLNQGTSAFPLGKVCVCVCVYTYIFLKVFFNFIFICKRDKWQHHCLVPLRVTYPPILTHNTDAGFFTYNQNGPLTFHFSILFQHSLKGLNKLYSSFIEIKGEFLLVFTDSCRKKNKIKKSCEKCSIIFCNLNLLNYLLK